jgi:hypothetical protein
MFRKLVAEVNYLEQVIPHGATRLAVAEVALYLDLLAQLKLAVNIV